MTHECNTHAFQRRLNEHYTSIICEPTNFDKVPDDIDTLLEIRKMEDGWHNWELARIADRRTPDTVDAFLPWYDDLKAEHWTKVSALFDFLAKESKPRHIAYYVSLEEQVDGKFDDVIALAQLGLQGREKLTIADNYWDEMGRGALDKMHTRMFAYSGAHMQRMLRADGIEHFEIPYQALKNGNLQLMYGLRRRHVGRLLGALGILEDTASQRFKATVEGMERCGFPKDVIEYHAAHVHFDSNHGEEWLENVLLPMFGRNPRLIREVSGGMLTRLHVAVDYYDSVVSWIRAH
ncbi:MAG: iron-containing redox enzyme family protein [Deltaproteobacteria bacterium]|nr:iron-containing redox enzyme family protein [Deltaproteobacteria bacterium]